MTLLLEAHLRTHDLRAVLIAVMEVGHQAVFDFWSAQVIALLSWVLAGHVEIDIVLCDKKVKPITDTKSLKSRFQNADQIKCMNGRSQKFDCYDLLIMSAPIRLLAPRVSCVACYGDIKLAEPAAGIFTAERWFSKSPYVIEFPSATPALAANCLSLVES